MPASTEATTSTLLIDVEGSRVPEDVAARMLEGYVEQSLNLPAVFVLRFTDDHATVLEAGRFTIGAKVTILVQRSGTGAPDPLLSGEVTALEAEVGPEGLYTVVRGMDMSHRLFRGTRVNAFLNMTAADVVRKVASAAGLTAGVIDITGPVSEQVSQDGVTDWEFLHTLAAHHGAVVTVTDGKLSFRKPVQASTGPAPQAEATTNPLVIDRRVNLVSLRATVTAAGQVPDVQVRGWDVKAKRELVGTAQAKTVTSAPGTVDPAAIAKTFGAVTHVVSHSAHTTQSQCDDHAKSLAERIAGGSAEIEGVVRGNVDLVAGVAVVLTNVGAQFTGKYTLTSTRHEFNPVDGYLTSFTASGASERSFYGVVAGADAPTRTTLGVLPAIVTNVKDPENQGRVKLKFPTYSDDYESWWVRVLQPGSGGKRGTVILPEVNDEVLVAFAEGDFSHPYVLGGLFNGKDTPDTPWSDVVHSDGTIKRRAFASRTGMVLEYLEGPDGEKLTLSTNRGKQRITLVQKPDAAIEIISEGPLKVTAMKDVTVEGQQNVSVTAMKNISVSTDTGDVTLKGKKVTVEAMTDLELKGMNVKMTGSVGADVKAPSVKVAGDATAELSGGAMTTVKGALVKIN